jgi:hypothetical protein
MRWLPRIFCPGGGSEFEAKPTPPHAIAMHTQAEDCNNCSHFLMGGAHIMRTAKSYWLNPC